MNKKRLWAILTAVVVFLLMVSVSPEIRLLGMFIEAIGLDMFVLLFEVQLLAISLSFYHRLISPALARVNALFERLDPYYFLTSLTTLRKCPSMIMHSVPFLVPFYLIIFLGISVYS